MAGSWNQQEKVPQASHPAVCSWRRGAAETRSWLGFIAPPQSQQWKHFYSLLSLQALLQRNPLPLEGFKVSIRGLVRKPLCVFFLDLVCLISVENLFISFEDSVPRVLDISSVWTYLKVHSQVMNARLCVNRQWLIWGLYMLCIEMSFTEVRSRFNQATRTRQTKQSISSLAIHYRYAVLCVTPPTQSQWIEHCWMWAFSKVTLKLLQSQSTLYLSIQVKIETDK